jgi:hypothetical protein
LSNTKPDISKAHCCRNGDCTFYVAVKIGGDSKK